MNDVDVIVLDLDGGEMLAECVASIRAQTDRILVFDNGSRVPSRVGGARIIRSETNLGFAGGANAAVQHATAEFVALINNDVLLDPDWLKTVRAAMSDDVGAVQTILRKDLITIDGAGIDISDGTFRQLGHGLPINTPLPEAWGVSATATLYRRELLRFDERFFAYYEDVELCARLHEQLWRTRVLPVVKATHRGSQSARHLPHAQRLKTRNRYFVTRMHPGVGRIRALVWEDVKLLLRGRSSPRGMWEGLTARV